MVKLTHSQYRCTILYIILTFISYSELLSQRCVTGGRHTIVLCENGSVISWGYNGYGQLGDGTSSQPQTVTTINGLSNVVHVSAGLFHSIFIQNDGTAFGCGRNLQGQLGDSTLTDKYVPIRMKFLPPIVKAAAGSEHSVFIAADSTVYATGLNNSGQLGDGTNISKMVPVIIPTLKNIVQVACGAEFSLFLHSNGTVWACGHNGSGQLGDGTNKAKNIPTQIPNLQDVVYISAGEWHSLFVKSDGTVWSCGRNSFGQLGIGVPLLNLVHTPTQVVGLNDIIMADAGGIHSVFVKKDGTAYACGLNSGDNNYGQLGDGTSIDKNIPTEIQFPKINEKIIHAEAAREHTILVTDKGNIWAVGRNNYGQLGIGTYTNTNFQSPILSNNTCNVGTITSINENYINDDLVKIFPNPISNQFTVELENDEEHTLQLFSTLGDEIFSKTTNDLITNVNVSVLSNGVYILKFSNSRRTYFTKIIVQN